MKLGLAVLFFPTPGKRGGECPHGDKGCHQEKLVVHRADDGAWRCNTEVDRAAAVGRQAGIEKRAQDGNPSHLGQGAHHAEDARGYTQPVAAAPRP